MFKVGDLITGIDYTSYAVTNKGKPLEVTSVSYNRIRVKCL